MLRSAVLALLLALGLPAAAGAQSITVADPEGRVQWKARVDRVGTQTCAVVFRGTVRRTRVCERLSAARVFSYNVRTETRPDPRASRTLFIITFAPTVVRARVQTPEGPVTYRRGNGPRVLLAVLAGRVERQPLRVDVRSRGRSRVVRGGQPAGLQIADPLGGPAWRTATGTARSGQSCVRWERVPPRFDAPPSPLLGAMRCGAAAQDLVVARAEVVDRRLVIVGLAGPDARGVVLRGAGEPRSLAVEQRTRAFLTVLPDGADPASLRLGVRLPSGREVERDVATGQGS